MLFCGSSDGELCPWRCFAVVSFIVWFLLEAFDFVSCIKKKNTLLVGLDFINVSHLQTANVQTYGTRS